MPRPISTLQKNPWSPTTQETEWIDRTDAVKKNPSARPGNRTQIPPPPRRAARIPVTVTSRVSRTVQYARIRRLPSPP